jgi:2-oxoglutarate dehydrogenase E1 component
VIREGGDFMKHLDFFNSGNLDYIESMYERYRNDPDSVDPSFRYFFSGFEAARTEIRVDAKTGKVSRETLPTEFLNDYEYGSVQIPGKNVEDEQERVFELISAYRKYGHLSARINCIKSPGSNPFIQLSEHGLGAEALSKTFYTGNLPGPDRRTLSEIMVRLEAIYCGSLAVEYVGIVQEVDEFKWLQAHTEAVSSDSCSVDERLWIYTLTYAAAEFERYLQRRYVGQKRFSLEGLDVLIPVLHALVDELGELGGAEVVLGMAHRGRLNVLANFMEKPYEQIFSEFEDLPAIVSRGDGDVKYHMGYLNSFTTQHGKTLSVSLNANPSHLELVNPVIQGKVYCRQKVVDDQDRTRVIPVLIHGDAAFAGQGINMEVLQLSQLRGYGVGGTLHIICDNQIGFTAEPHESRSTRYATDLFRMSNTPVFHVNGDDPEAAVRSIRLAVQFRQKFRKDVAVNLVGYRRHGHNEGDEPSFTQPMMYTKIRSHPSVHEIYRRELVGGGCLDEAPIQKIESLYKERLREAESRVESRGIACVRDSVEPGWQDVWQEDRVKRSTGVSQAVLLEVIQGISQLPEDFKANRKIRRFITQRTERFEGDNIDWALAESLCFGSLLLDDYRVRLSGQDSRRGTFAHRNLVAFSEEDGSEYIPLNHIRDNQREICVFNSMLSEQAVLGFEYGFALGNPETLVMWEAQFGDFANGAQSMIDVFLSSGESKWQVMNGLVLLLPHGYEGQGPEHSSARLERYLSLCAAYNLRVCVPSTPANYFHVLRRQVLKKDRKPLVLMTPKSLLRAKRCHSVREDFLEERVFLKVIVGTPGAEEEHAGLSRLVMCSGKLYYDLLELKEAKGLKDMELVRLEQLYPFPFKTILRLVESCPNLTEVVWAQEERRNMGAWTYLEPRLRAVLKGKDVPLYYVGRSEGASPCVASSTVHKEEQKHIVSKALARDLEEGGSI